MMELDKKYDFPELQDPSLVDGATFDTTINELAALDAEQGTPDVIRDVPEMTMDDINALTYDEIEKILDGYNRFPESDAELYKIASNCPSDDIGKYIMLKGKKLYIQLEYGDHNILKSGKSCILLAYSEGEIYIDGIGRYNSKKHEFEGVVNENGKTKKGKIKLFDSRYK